MRSLKNGMGGFRKTGGRRQIKTATIPENQCVLTILTYRAETCTLTKQNTYKIAVA